MSIFARASLRFPASEPEGAGNEAGAKQLPVTQSAHVQHAQASSATLTRRKSALAQSDAASYPKSSGLFLQASVGSTVLRWRLRRRARSRKALFLRQSRLSAQDRKSTRLNSSHEWISY